MTLGPTRAGRRKITTDRLYETLEAWGDPHPAEHATALLHVIEDCGWALPPALDDPAPPPTRADPSVQAAAMAEIRATLERRREAAAKHAAP